MCVGEAGFVFHGGVCDLTDQLLPTDSIERRSHDAACRSRWALTGAESRTHTRKQTRRKRSKHGHVPSPPRTGHSTVHFTANTGKPVERVLTPTGARASQELLLLWIPHKILPSAVAVFISRHVSSSVLSPTCFTWVGFRGCGSGTSSSECSRLSPTGNAKGPFRSRLRHLYHTQFIRVGKRLRPPAPVISYPPRGRGGLRQITTLRCFLRKRRKKGGGGTERGGGVTGKNTTEWAGSSQNVQLSSLNLVIATSVLHPIQSPNSTAVAKRGPEPQTVYKEPQV